MEQIQFISTSPENLAELISEAVKKELQKVSSPIQAMEQKELLSTDEVCQLLQINKSTLYHWVNQGKVKVYGIGGRRYYKQSEIIKSLTPLNKKRP